MLQINRDALFLESKNPEAKQQNTINNLTIFDAIKLSFATQLIQLLIYLYIIMYTLQLIAIDSTRI